jgi:DNA-binding transcriptional regulator YhcF (GntR family)
VLETQRGVGTFVQEVGSQAASLSERERQLMALADRFLTGAATLGFSAHEAIALLKTRWMDMKREKSDA